MTAILALFASALALVIFALGTKAGRSRYEPAHQSARPAWHAPEVKKDRTRLQKLAKRNAKNISKAVHH
ncbi:hypothetical protein [Cryobacterium sp. AP23]